MRAERLLVPAFVVGWLVAIALGVVALYSYMTRPGAVGVELSAFPPDSKLPRSTTGVTVISFVHPDCPCSRATVTELSRIRRDAPAGSRFLLVFVGHGDGSLWASAGTYAELERILDDGIEARRFGALTSGYTLAVAANGRVLFRGGITAARGHAGKSAGGELLEAALRDRREGTNPVFGCGLLGDLQ